VLPSDGPRHRGASQDATTGTGEEASDGQNPAVAERLRITLCDLLKVVSITLEPTTTAACSSS